MFSILNSIPEYSNTFVVLMGLGTVFAGLIVIIICCYIMSFIMRTSSSKEEAPALSSVQAAPVAQQTSPIENKQELVAAISAAVAENLGKDVSAIRITSIKRV